MILNSEQVAEPLAAVVLTMSRRRKSSPHVDVAQILLSPVTVRINDEVKKLDPFAAQLETCVSKALRGDIRACAKFIRLCLKEGLIQKPAAFDDFRSREVIPKDWDRDEWKAMYWKYGSPPWPGPRDGLTAEERDEWRATQRRRRSRGSRDQNG